MNESHRSAGNGTERGDIFSTRSVSVCLGLSSLSLVFICSFPLFLSFSHTSSLSIFCWLSVCLLHSCCSRLSLFSLTFSLCVSLSRFLLCVSLAFSCCVSLQYVGSSYSVSLFSVFALRLSSFALSLCLSCLFLSLLCVFHAVGFCLRHWILLHTKPSSCVICR